MKFKLFMFTTTPVVLTLVGSMATLLSTLISLLASNPALQIGIVAGILILIGVIVVFWMYMGITTLVLQKKIEKKKEKYLEEESDQLMNETKESEGKTKSKKKTKKKLLKITGQKNISKPGMTTSVTLNTTLLQNETNLHVMKSSGFRIATSASSQSGERAGGSTITPTLVLGVSGRYCTFKDAHTIFTALHSISIDRMIC